MSMTARSHQNFINCVMNTTYVVTAFDEKEVCDHSNTFYQHTLPNWHTGEHSPGKWRRSELAR